MRKSLGSTILFAVALFGADLNYNIDVSNKNPYKKEPITVDVDINQTDTSKVMLYRFDFEKSSRYEVHRIDVKENDPFGHHHSLHIRYLVFALSDGKVYLRPKLVKRVTNDESVKYNASGDRDDYKSLKTTYRIIKVAPVELNVKSTPKQTSVVGDFEIVAKIDKKEANSFEPIYLHIRIDGVGYLPKLKLYTQLPKEVKLFEDTPDIKVRYDEYGAHSHIEYFYSFSSKSSFVLPKQRIFIFDPKRKEFKKREISEYKIQINETDADLLVDEVDSPKRSEATLDALLEKVWVLFVFLSGWVSAWIYLRIRQMHSRKSAQIRDSFIQKIEDAKSLDELYRISLAHPKMVSKETLNTIQSAKKSKIGSVWRYKKEILKAL